jgi:hypothetical protein
MLGRAAIAGFAVGVIGLAVVARSSSDSSPSRLPALAFGEAADTQAQAAALPIGPDSVEYRVRGTLPDLPARAPAWELGRDGDGSRVETLARALGLAGPVKAGADGWTVAAGGRSLRVARQPGLPWYFGPDAGDAGCVVPASPPGTTPPAPDTPVASDACGSSGAAVGATGSAGADDSANVSSSSATTATRAPTTATTIVGCPLPPCPPGSVCPAIACPSPEPVPAPERPADLPTREQAEATARALLVKAGVDLDGARVRVEDGFSQWQVTVDPQVGGLPTIGYTSGVSVGPKGAVEGANGWLAQPVRGDEYPLVTAASGLERLKQSPYGIGPQPLIARAPVCDGCETQAPPVRTITGVRVGLAFAPVLGANDEGRALLVPVLLFDVDDGDILPVLAVADEFLPKPVPDEKPVPEPAPVTTEPGTEPVTAPGPAGSAS